MSTGMKGYDPARAITEVTNRLGDRLGQLETAGRRYTVLNLVGTGAATLLGTVVYPLAPRTAVAIAGGVCAFVAFLCAGLRKALVESDLDRLRAGAAKLSEISLGLASGRIGGADAAQRLGEIGRELPGLPSTSLSIDSAHGTIVHPCAATKVDAFLIASGTVHDVERGVYIWLTVDVDNRIWPKSGRIAFSGGAWEQGVHQPNVGSFSLTLWAVNAYADRKLRRWLKDGARKTDYPGLAPLPGMKWLAHVGGMELAAMVDEAAGPAAPA